eukprot:TRINITY_DN4383_c0_g1_i1.p1 TRINITY_DN4383_c0_g1~~TRINITY_DN4383_c0_g1_i1.p1  ORF type:complete len:406 (-),score=99.22 TRINITY_DN4383_c0_g1_i1:212-1429(-)
MAKASSLSGSKEFDKRNKQRGLQKLKYYCQMCEKQCRDANGFKCHCLTEGHQRQMALYRDNPEMFARKYTDTFVEGFCTILATNYGAKRVNANQVYQQYIREKNHIHMNSTIFESLGGFVQYLGDLGKCVIEDTERGWFVQWIDPIAAQRQKEWMDKRKSVLDEEQRHQKFLEKQAKRAKKEAEKLMGETETVEHGELKREEGDTSKFTMSFSAAGTKAKKKKKALAVVMKKPSIKDNDEESEEAIESKPEPAKKISVITDSESHSERKEDSRKRPRSSVSDLINEDQRNRRTNVKDLDRRNRREYWLRKHLIVKIANKKLGDGKFYKKKAEVTDVIDRFLGELRVLDSGAKIRIDQDELETIIPEEGELVMVVNGAYRGEVARLLRKNDREYEGDLRIKSGRYK